MYSDDIKLFAKTEKELETLIQAVWIYSQDIGMEFDKEKCSMFIMKIGRRQMTEGIELPKQEKIWTLGERKQIFGNIGQHQTRDDERKRFKIISQENEKTTWNQTT